MTRQQQPCYRRFMALLGLGTVVVVWLATQSCGSAQHARVDATCNDQDIKDQTLTALISAEHQNPNVWNAAVSDHPGEHDIAIAQVFLDDTYEWAQGLKDKQVGACYAYWLDAHYSDLKKKRRIDEVQKRVGRPPAAVSR